MVDEPVRLDHVLPPFVETYHAYVSGAVPLALTLNVAFSPAVLVRSLGCVVICGATAGAACVTDIVLVIPPPETVIVPLLEEVFALALA